MANNDVETWQQRDLLAALEVAEARLAEVRREYARAVRQHEEERQSRPAADLTAGQPETRPTSLDNAARIAQLVRLATRAEGPAAFHVPEDVLLDWLMQADLFSRDFYVAHNPDIAAAGMDAAHHYIRYGIDEQRLPSPL